MKSSLKLISLSILWTIISCSAFAKSSDSGNWIVRARALHVKTDTSSKVSTLGGHVATSSDQVPELDFTRFITPNIAAELILATTEHNVTLNGSVLGNKTALGSVKLLPPTLTLQYHVNPSGTVRPYVGAGLNYTFFYGEHTEGPAKSMKYQNHLGYALQAGFDYMINEKFGINFDIKKIYLKTNVQINDAYTAKVRLDPWLIGAGISYHF